MIRPDLAAAAEKRGLRSGGDPGLKLSGEVAHYKTSSAVDTSSGPLEEVVVRTKLTDAPRGAVVVAADLIGRSNSTSANGVKYVSAGLGKALGKWLKKTDEKQGE